MLLTQITNLQGQIQSDGASSSGVSRQPDTATVPQPVGVALNKPKTHVKKPVRYGIDETISYALVVAGEAPESYVDAMVCPEAQKWQDACDEETL